MHTITYSAIGKPCYSMVSSMVLLYVYRGWLKIGKTALRQKDKGTVIFPQIPQKSKMDIEDLLMWFRFDSAWGGLFVMFY